MKFCELIYFDENFGSKLNSLNSKNVLIENLTQVIEPNLNTYEVNQLHFKSNIENWMLLPKVSLFLTCNVNVKY